MSHPLDGVDAKLARADTHFNVVREAIEAMTSPDTEVIPGDFDAASGEYVFRATRDSWHPDWLAPVIGDCVHNTRAALDYLIWELVRVNGRSGTTSTEFPIFTDPTRYAEKAPGKLRGVDPRAESVIASLQPFAGPNSKPSSAAWRDPEGEPLSLLYRLDIRDKHRSLVLTEDALSVRLEGLLQYGIHTSGSRFTLPAYFVRGQIVARLGSTRPGMDVYLSALTHIAFEREGPAAGESVLQTLARIRQDVRGRVLPALAPFFPQR